MTDHYTLALDAMGGDFGPEAVVPAAGMALKQLPGVRFLLVGDERRIAPLLDRDPNLKAVSAIIHTDKSIRSDEKPSVALRNSRDTSMRLAIEAVKDGKAEGAVSAGNTGALMATAKMILKCLPGISRPAIAGVFPTRGEDIVMLDLGANVACNEEILVQFALMGAVYARNVMGIANPSVGLLNVGSEDMKGNDQVRAAAAILSHIQLPGRFYGFIEGNDIPAGTVDVVVTDGFTGNVALKVAEGVAALTGFYLKRAFATSLLAKIGGLLAYNALKKIKNHVDPRYHNGGMFLGLNGICVKSHGGMDAYGFSRAILVAAGLVRNGYNQRVASEIEHLMTQESFLAALSGTQAEGA